MAIIKCAECNKDVSENAISCPFCGNPIKNYGIVTIEKTSKHWKFIKLISCLGIIAGFIWFMNGYESGGFNNWISEAGFILMFVSAVGLIVSKFGAWWYNK
mgnify:FL=1